MTPIDNIMALADQYMGWGAASDRQALRAAIEKAIKMEQLNYEGCMHDLAEAEKALKPGEPVAKVIDGVLASSSLPEKYTGYLYTAPQPQPCNPAEDGVCEALECCKDTVVKLRITANELIERDTALLRQALYALEWCEPAGTVGHGGIQARKQAIAALRERLKS
jgi:hypothetical protein